MRTFSDWKCKCGVTTIHFDDDASVAFIGEGSDAYAKHNPVANAITHIICRRCNDKCFVGYDVKWYRGEPKNKPPQYTRTVLKPDKPIKQIVIPPQPMETVDIDFLDELPEEL